MTRCRPAPRPDVRAVRGFTLIEAAIGLTIIGLLAGGALFAGGILIGDTQEDEVQARLDRIEEALVAFVTVNRRLPCPTRPSASFGVEDRPGGSCGGNQANGVVPWRTLGLSMDEVLDPWQHFITYRVYDDGADSLVGAGGMDFTDCLADAERGSGGCDSGGAIGDELADKGLRVGTADGVADLAVPADGTGAAYVLISHGVNGYLALLPPDGDHQAPGPADNAALEDPNDPATAVTDFDTYTVVAPQLGNFDDRVRWKTILRLAEDAGLGPDDNADGGSGSGSGGGGGGGGGGPGDGDGSGADIDLDFPALDFDTEGNSGNFADRSDLKFSDGALAAADATDYDVRITAQNGNGQVSYDRDQHGGGEKTLGVGHGNNDKGELSGNETLTLEFTGTYSHFGATLHFFEAPEGGSATVTGYLDGAEVGARTVGGTATGDVELPPQEFAAGQLYDTVVISVSGGASVGLKTFTATNP